MQPTRSRALVVCAVAGAALAAACAHDATGPRGLRDGGTLAGRLSLGATILRGGAHPPSVAARIPFTASVRGGVAYAALVPPRSAPGSGGQRPPATRAPSLDLEPEQPAQPDDCVDACGPGDPGRGSDVTYQDDIIRQISDLRASADSDLAGGYDPDEGMFVPVAMTAEAAADAGAAFSDTLAGYFDAATRYRVEGEPFADRGPLGALRVYRNDTLRATITYEWDRTADGWVLRRHTGTAYDVDGTIAAQSYVTVDTAVEEIAGALRRGARAVRATCDAVRDGLLGVLAPPDALAGTDCLGPKIAIVGSVIGMVSSALTGNPIGFFASMTAAAASTVSMAECEERRRENEERMRRLEDRLQRLEQLQAGSSPG